MTKKDYIAFGSVLAGAWANSPPREKGVLWSVTLSIADVFAQDNPRFDRAKFYDFVLGTPDPFVAREETRDG